MFQYTDPVGRNFLSNSSVASVFQQQMHSIYDGFARRVNSGFTWLEAFQQLSDGGMPQPVTVDWSAFPITAQATDQIIDRDRFDHQDEYVEWHAEMQQNKLIRVTFTTEFPEYFEAFAAVGFDELVNAIHDVIPDGNPTVGELFGPGFSPAANSSLARSRTFRNRLAVNPWNNGQKGILCLTQQFNTLGALFNLLAACGVLKTQGTPENTCALVASTGACGPGRSSDPAVCAEAQRAVRGDLGFSLRDPAGVRIVRLEGVWKLSNSDIDINDPTLNQGIWVVNRNGRRGVLTVKNALTLDSDPLVTGAQIARKLKVAADLFAAPSANLPEWARIGVESSSRGPE
ncbi:MAG: hypothetical protein ACREV4_12450 [Gammaproteobacteria bacterium]